MMSDVNLVSALGPSTGPGTASSSSSAPADAAPGDRTFASLVDNAAAGREGTAGDIDLDSDVQIDPHAVNATNPDANEAQANVAAAMLALPEWWLRGSPG
jgi:hypothetical protein